MNKNELAIMLGFKNDPSPVFSEYYLEGMRNGVLPCFCQKFYWGGVTTGVSINDFDLQNTSVDEVKELLFDRACETYLKRVGESGRINFNQISKSGEK